MVHISIIFVIVIIEKLKYDWELRIYLPVMVDGVPDQLCYHNSPWTKVCNSSYLGKQKKYNNTSKIN